MPERVILTLTLLLSGAVSADYVRDRQAAAKLMRSGKHQEALAAFTKMAEGKVSDFQRADALEQAAACARRLRKFDLAAQLAGRIPLRPVAATVQMQNLLAMRKAKELVEKFKNEDIDTWPFWKAGEAFYARGRAFCEVGEGTAAEQDLAKAVELTTDDLARARVWLVLGRNREENLKDEEKALAAYSKIVEMDKHHGNAVYYRGLICTARILGGRGKHAAAEATLRKVSIHKLSGYWHAAMLLALGGVLSDANRGDEALAAYREILADEKVHPGQRKAAREAIKATEASAR